MPLARILQNLNLLSPATRTRRLTCVGFYSSKQPRQGIIKELDPDTGTLKTKKVQVIPKITLLSGDSVSVTTLYEAEKLSRRRDLKLVKVVDTDTKTERPVYQLMTGAEYHAEDLKQREKNKLEKQERRIKGEKVLLLHSRIAFHDLDVQMRKAVKWINKMYEVRVIISGGGNVETSEKIYSHIEQYFRNEECHGQLVQKRSKGSDIKFQIVPPKCKDTDSAL